MPESNTNATKGRKIVSYVKEGMQRKDIFCTTYQMRNFYVQLHDGFFNNLEFMNWLQHLHCLKHIGKNDIVLDLCCGRGLLLPLLKRNRNKIKQYIGVDISEKNVEAAETRAGFREIDYRTYYPFPVVFYCPLPSSQIACVLPPVVDVIVFLASVEHMQKDEAEKTLQACFDVLKSGGKMIISTPNTREARADGYECQYRAHLYEWNMEELIVALEACGFEIEEKYGILTRKRDLSLPENEDEDVRRIERFLPYEIFTVIAAIPHPEVAKEVLLVVRKPKKNETRLKK